MAKATDEGPDMVSLREVARRVVAEGIANSMSHQRVSQLAREDPDFPPVHRVGRSNSVDWHLAQSYFRSRVTQQGKRTDLGK
ncbi:hypothetical protein [Streptomyces sp. NPDC058202]|uniref:hypothetical protein n=1 Tax=Streptomyces sp. NPDC058202 TaxID=3346380 RepID=UPI0036E93387